MDEKPKNERRIRGFGGPLIEVALALAVVGYLLAAAIPFARWLLD